MTDAATSTTTATVTMEADYFRQAVLALKERRTKLRAERSGSPSKTVREIAQRQLERVEDAIHHISIALGEY